MLNLPDSWCLCHLHRHIQCHHLPGPGVCQEIWIWHTLQPGEPENWYSTCYIHVGKLVCACVALKHQNILTVAYQCCKVILEKYASTPFLETTWLVWTFFMVESSLIEPPPDIMCWTYHTYIYVNLMHIHYVIENSLFIMLSRAQWREPEMLLWQPSSWSLAAKPAYARWKWLWHSGNGQVEQCMAASSWVSQGKTEATGHL